MTRRLTRTADYELSLQIRSDAFLRPPRDSQRNWLINRTLRDTAAELEHLNRIAPTMVPGADAAGNVADRTQSELSDDEIMEDWQIPVMQAMAAEVTAAGGDVLEVGFGRGVGSDFIQAGGVRSHTIVECNDSVVARYRQWRDGYPKADIRLLHGLWQDVMPQAGQFDGIFFHTYPLNEDEFVESVLKTSTFAENFFDVAARHLRPGGVFTYLTAEPDSLSRAHQRALLSRFAEVKLRMIRDLPVPDDTRDALWTRHMVLVTVRA